MSRSGSFSGGARRSHSSGYRRKITMIYYHATFGSNLKGIKANGLGGKHKANWEDSEQGKIYLDPDPEVAFSYCESADEDMVSESKYNSGIVVLAVDSKQLDPRLVGRDTANKEKNRSITYSGVIPAYKLFVVNKGKIGLNLLGYKRVPRYR